MLSPAAYIREVVASDGQSKGVVWLAFFKGIQSADGVVRLRHCKFDVINQYLRSSIPFGCTHAGRGWKMAGDSCQGCVVAVTGGIAADAVLERILWRYDQIDHIKTGLLDKVFHYREVADM